ncbi:hypothetical protein ACVRWQ_04650 [Streptococcus phocae subsp. salmonis]|uniref:hypothetical protein n=1 Tax=Streptococcus phocae TaxID=119224 RepID=UPI0005315282|nr:hypothetical protein [Streptococcus phocae]KGR73353.1 hypothetical protein NX86_00730 [Streptococcus phocae subsp. salmonis]
MVIAETNKGFRLSNLVSCQKALYFLGTLLTLIGVFVSCRATPVLANQTASPNPYLIGREAGYWDGYMAGYASKTETIGGISHADKNYQQGYSDAYPAGYRDGKKDKELGKSNKFYGGIGSSILKFLEEIYRSLWAMSSYLIGSFIY